MGGVMLDCHAPASAVTALAPGEVDGQVFFPHRQPGRNTVEDYGQPLAVRFAGRQQPERHAGTQA